MEQIHRFKELQKIGDIIAVTPVTLANLTPGNPGNKGGTGRPPSRIRELCREKFEDGVPKMAEILLSDSESTSNADRIRAMDLFGKYGMGEASATEETISKVAKCYLACHPDASVEQLKAFGDALMQEFS